MFSVRSSFLRSIVLTTLLFMSASVSFGQKYMTKNGYIKFFSETPLETVLAENKQVNAALDATTGDFIFKVLVQSFEFPKALMQEHFNENFIESEKYPNATFKGKVTNLKSCCFTKEGTNPVTVEGDLTMHGVTKTISEPGTLIVTSDGKILAKSKFKLKPGDFNIQIPGAVLDKIASDIEVTVDVEMTKI
jgi:hypothetical protein